MIFVFADVGVSMICAHYGELALGEGTRMLGDFAVQEGDIRIIDRQPR